MPTTGEQLKALVRGGALATGVEAGTGRRARPGVRGTDLKRLIEGERAQGPPIPAPIKPPLTSERPPGAGETFGRELAARFIGNLLAVPELAAAAGIEALTPRPERHGPIEAAAGAIRAVTGGRVDPFAAGAELRARDRPLGLPTGREAVAGIEGLAVAPRGVARGEPLDLGERALQAEERGAAARETQPAAAFAGEVGGDVASLMLGRPLRGRLRALEGRRAALPASRRAPGFRRELDDIVRSRLMRGLEQGGLRIGEASLEGATLAVLNDQDPVTAAAFAGGAQAMGSAAIGLNQALLSGGTIRGLGKTGLTFLGMTAVIQMLKEKIPGGRDRILESLESSGTALASVMALGFLAGTAGLGRSGARFSENLPRVADAISTMPRGAVISLANDLFAADDRGDPALETIVGKLAEDPEFFGAATARRLARAFERGRFAEEVDKLMKRRDFRRRVDEIE